ncbi:hypothetical protein KCM76_09590 [Zooshikella marina]|uniref:hypothetical protein n=1 Tax=Zooshikella ganghwensis TaxID=202772 RepID=UPI001BAFCC5E|nr:hypothetical protein [Zooshikella ganghwensis]MBU2706239.1 hypothetical protein [Zooshikella ganghwensis]
MTNRQAKNDLLYLVYGESEVYYKQAYFSILTALNYLNVSCSVRICVLTEKPEFFKKLPVFVEKLTGNQKAEWMGGGTYIHRIKTLSQIYWMKKYKSNTAFVDTDTWFNKSPEHIFSSVDNDSSVMYEYESDVKASLPSLCHKVKDHEFSLGDGRKLNFQEGQLWNSGVIGLSFDNRYLLDDALSLIDKLYLLTNEYVTEQLVVGEVIRQNTKIQGCRNVLYHYYGADLLFINDKISVFLKENVDKDIAEQASLTATFPYGRCGKNKFQVLLIKLISKILGIDKETMRAIQGIKIFLLDSKNSYFKADQHNWLIRSYNILNDDSNKPKLSTKSYSFILFNVEKLIKSEKLSVEEKKAWIPIVRKLSSLSVR